MHLGKHLVPVPEVRFARRRREAKRVASAAPEAFLKPWPLPPPGPALVVPVPVREAFSGELEESTLIGSPRDENLWKGLPKDPFRGIAPP